MLNVVVSNCKVVEFTRYIPLVFANLIPAQGEVDFIQLYVIKYLKKKIKYQYRNSRKIKSENRRSRDNIDIPTYIYITAYFPGWV